MDSSRILNTMESLASSFAELAVSMKQGSAAFQKIAEEFEKVASTAAHNPATPPPTPMLAPAAPLLIDTAGPAALKATKAYFEDHYMAAIRRSIEIATSLAPDDKIIERFHEYERGCIRTIDGRPVLIYKFYAFEPPTDRHYTVPGPLQPIGFVDAETLQITAAVPAPPLPTIHSDWPW